MLEEEETMDGARVREMEGEDDGDIQPGPDPFVQPPILKVFFEQLPVEELARCRLVSKLWYEESLSTWRSSTTLKFGKEGIVSKRVDGSKRTTSLGEFLDLWVEGEWGSCPFKKFILHNWKFEAEDVEQQRFLELVGGHVTSLTLEYCSFVGRDDFRRIIYQAFPKLQFLSMDYCEVDKKYWHQPEEIITYKEPAYGVHDLKSFDISGGLPHSMMDMLNHFRKLRSLQVDWEVWCDYPNLLEIIRLIREQDQTNLPLKDFDVKFPFELGHSTASEIEVLRQHEQLNLPLQRLWIYFGSVKDEEKDWNFSDILRDILQRHCSTLKYLEFRGNDWQYWHGLCKTFPFGICLENLEELTFKFTAPKFFDHLNFLRYTPKLRDLVLECFQPLSLSESDKLFFNSSQLEIGGWTLPTLKQLSLPSTLCMCNLRKLMKWMPNLEGLWGLRLDDVKFSMVCNAWKNLKELSDGGTELTDEGVIGIGNAHGAGGNEETSICPNITKLKNLTWFHTASSKLTSVSVKEGLLKLANMEGIWLGRATKLDDEAKAAIERRNIELRFIS